jgi:hypothetical protein
MSFLTALAAESSLPRRGAAAYEVGKGFVLLGVGCTKGPVEGSHPTPSTQLSTPTSPLKRSGFVSAHRKKNSLGKFSLTLT